MTVANTNKLVNLFTDDGKAYVDELPEDGTIKIIIPSLKANLEEMRHSLDEMLPAHLAYNFQHVIELKIFNATHQNLTEVFKSSRRECLTENLFSTTR